VEINVVSATATARVIADGQEDLVRQMFAAPLPEHWRFADARIEPARIVARYKRARDGAAVEFVLSAAVPGARLRTERFAIDIRSTQAAGDVTPLVRAVLASVRAVEATFVWTELCAPPPRPPPPPPPPPQSALSTASAPDPFEAMLVARYEPFRVAATIAPGVILDTGTRIVATDLDAFGNAVFVLAFADGGSLEILFASRDRSVDAIWKPPGGARSERLARMPEALAEGWRTSGARIFPHMSPAPAPGSSRDLLTLDVRGVTELLSPEASIGADFAGHRLLACRSPSPGRVSLEFEIDGVDEALEITITRSSPSEPGFFEHGGMAVVPTRFASLVPDQASAQALRLCSHLSALIASKLSPDAKIVSPREGPVAPPSPVPVPGDHGEVLNLNFESDCGQACSFCPIKSFAEPRDGGDEALVALLAEVRAAARRGLRRSRINGVDPLRFSKILEVIEALRAEGFAHLDVLGPNRRFADPSFRHAFLQRAPRQVRVVMPLYGVSEAVHDRVTGAPGSQAEALAAMAALVRDLGSDSVALSTVITAENVDEFAAIVDFALGRGLSLWPQLPYPLRNTRSGAYPRVALRESEIVSRVLAGIGSVPKRSHEAVLRALAMAIRHPCVLHRAQLATGVPVFDAARALPRQALAGVAQSDRHKGHDDGARRSLTPLNVTASPCPAASRCGLHERCAGEHYDLYAELFGVDEFVAVETPPRSGRSDAAR
jgi:hypothetical protein